MRYQLLSLFLAPLAVLLVGCEESMTETSQETSPEITARFCHIARIGNLAEMPDDLWEDPASEKAVTLHSLPGVPDLMESVPAKAVGEEVDPDVLAIVESTANESSSEEGLKKAKEKEEELDLAIEMVEEKQKTDAAVQESLEQDAKAKESAQNGENDAEEAENTENGNEDEDEEIAIPMTVENPEEAEEAEADEDQDEAEAPANEPENPAAEDGEEEQNPLEKEESHRFEQMDSELERQAEEFLNLLKETPKEVREELENAHFQNVSYRLVKIPGMFFQSATSGEYYIVRTMEYTGSNLSHDFQVLNHSPNYSQWINNQEKFLEIMTLDSLHHECWVEVPEFWNSSKE